MIDTKGLSRALEPAEHLIIFLHDNPDPDAVASGWLLYRIARSLGLKAERVHGGSLGRAENSAMVRLLDIPLQDPEAWAALTETLTKRFLDALPRKAPEHRHPLLAGPEGADGEEPRSE